MIDKVFAEDSLAETLNNILFFGKADPLYEYDEFDDAEHFYYMEYPDINLRRIHYILYRISVVIYNNTQPYYYEVSENDFSEKYLPSMSELYLINPEILECTKNAKNVEYNIDPNPFETINKLELIIRRMAKDIFTINEQDEIKREFGL